jgi:rod shape determining protein RodA
MHPLLKKLFRLNWVLVALMFALLIYGVYSIYSASEVHGQHFWRAQLIWIFVSLPVFIAVSLIDYRWVKWGALPLYLVSLALLVLVLVHGSKHYGAKCWLNLGFMSFQPSQVAIIGGILTIALFLERSRRMPSFLRVLACGVLVGAPWMLILIEPDLGMCIVWVPVVLAMMFIGGIP